MSRREKKGGCGCGCGCGTIFWILIIIIIIVAIVNGVSDNNTTDYYDNTGGGYSQYDDDVDPDGGNEYPDDGNEYPDSGNVPDLYPTDNPADSLYRTLRIPLYRNKYFELDDTGKEIYAALRNSILCNQTSVKFYNVDIERYKDVAYTAFLAVYHDFPEFFWIREGCRWQWDSDWFSVTPYLYDFWTYTSNPKGYVSDVEAAAVALYNKASGYSTDYDKVKFVHDYLVSTVYYDDECLETINQTVQSASSQQSHTIYGALVSELAVCDGYAKTFQLIMNMLGINAEYIDGDTPGGGHAWNHLELNGEDYWMDVTWNDKDLEYEKGDLHYENFIDYSYFCTVSNGFVDSHTPNGYFMVPNCTSLQDNYHFRNGYYLNTYSFDGICNIMAKQQGQKYVTVRFSDSYEHNKALSDLFEGSKRYFDIPYFGKIKDMRYMYNEEMCTIIFMYH